MPFYSPPIADFRFLLQEVFAYDSTVAELRGYEDANLELVLAVLESAGRFVSEVVLPINLSGDSQGCRRDDAGVHTPQGYREAYAAYRAAGWPALAGDPAYGGQGLPVALGLFVRELVASGSMSFGMYGGLSQGAYRAILAHGSEALRRTFLPPLVDGRWTGTMCMTEPECGSDLSRLRTRAVPAGDGSYRITGSKIFISGGDHDLAENIVHLVLARLPDAPAGTRGISLFVVPKRPTALGTGRVDATALNGVVCTAIEHKMGIRASATAALAFEDAQGFMVGEPNGGLQAMFTMMNSSRMGVAVQSVGVAEISYQNALRYALERRQGRAPGSESAAPHRIVEHPDVRNNLLTMKAWVEGARALYVESALALDVRARHPDAARRRAAEDRLALMTPVLKSFLSDCAVQVADLGITVWGGHGYVHDNGVEQWLRDARIVPLYEGTNAIQALDLVHRKLPQDGGETVRDFISELARRIERHVRDETVGPLCAPLAAALKQLQDATAKLAEWRGSDPVATAAAASDYLRLFGLVAMGGAWLRMAAAASTASATSAGADFNNGKIKTARFFMARLLPEADRLHRRLGADKATIMDVAPEEL
jgi:alkylation response protein AidB-like acyl-CoA dehydrogenase